MAATIGGGKAITPGPDTLALLKARGFPRPIESRGPDGGMIWLWYANEHYLDLEFEAGEEPEFFYRNKITGQIASAGFEAAEADEWMKRITDIYRGIKVVQS